MKEWYNATALSGLPGLPSNKRNVQLKARREKWEVKTEVVRGGTCEMYHISSLPPETQAALGLRESQEEKITPFGVISALPEIGEKVRYVDPAPAPVVTTGSKPVSERKQAKLDAWIEILALRDRWCLAQGHTITVDGDIYFAEAYNKREIDPTVYTCRHLYNVVPEISRTTIARKRADLKKKPGTPSGQSPVAPIAAR